MNNSRKSIIEKIVFNNKALMIFSVIVAILIWATEKINYSDEVTPVPIPNTAVKLICAHNTWLETAREDR